ncbi:MAG: GtrA family protein [Phototrophicales bacterium]|nr:MAG: GtrA family protein [Phototrophicales bacterium]
MKSTDLISLSGVTLALWRREIVRYVIGGGVNTALTYAIYLLLLLIAPWQIANTVSYVAGIFTAYYINARFVFRQPLRWRKVVQFPLVYLLHYALTMVLSALLIDGLGIDAALAPIIVIGITVPATFLAARLLLKPRPRADQRPIVAP